MRVFEQVNTSPQFLKCDDQSFWVTLSTLGGATLADSWAPRALQLRGAPSADIPWLGNHGMVLNKRAVDALRPVLDPCGELLPIEVDGDKTYRLFNPLLVIDALAEASEIEYFRSTGKIKTILRPELKPDLIEGIDLFKLAGPHSSPLLLSEAFVEVVTDAGLVGPGYRLVWPLPPGQQLARIPKPDYERLT